MVDHMVQQGYTFRQAPCVGQQLHECQITEWIHVIDGYCLPQLLFSDITMSVPAIDQGNFIQKDIAFPPCKQFLKNLTSFKFLPFVYQKISLDESFSHGSIP